MNLQNATTDYLRTLEKRIKILLTDGQTNRQQITRALSDEEKKYLQRLQREIFLTLRVQSDKSDQVKFASSILKSYTLLGDRIEGDVLFEVKRGIKKELSVDQVAKNIRGRLDVAEHTSKTISRTASGGVGNASRIAQAAEAGLTFFRYGGSQSPERPFCKEHINKVYSLVDIRAMDNDQGLPVEFFGGGYNCRHFWVAVDSKDAIVPGPVAPKSKVSPPEKVSPVKEKKPQVAPGEGKNIPDGIPVSDAHFPDGLRGEALDSYNEAHRLIDSVVGDGSLSRIPIKPMGGRKNFGLFQPGADGKGVHIKINTNEAVASLFNKTGTVVHETAHHIDYENASGSGWSRKRMSEDEGQAKPIVDLLRGIVKDKIYSNFTSRARRRYYLSDEEVFARAYTQYVKEKSSGWNYARFDKNITTGVQWTREEFAPASKMFDELFKKLGWLK